MNDISKTIDIWLSELEQYEFAQLCIKPSPNSWSLGQLYVHIIEATHYFIEEAKICTTNNEKKDEEAASEAKIMFLNNEFPDIQIEGPPSNDLTEQPQSKEQLVRELYNLKIEVENIEMLISNSIFKGKTKHPGLKYFSAYEWIQFAKMHLRHHFRQQKRIVEFLRQNQLA